jgi:uncharacterized protein (PEP-CTERM system associated)
VTRDARPRTGARRRVAALAVAVAAAGAHAQEGWRVEPYLTVRETFTNNVNLAPSGQQQSDAITELTPGVRIDGNGPRVQLNGTVQAQTLWYARTGDQNNVVYPQVNLRGRVDAVEDFFFVDGSIAATQQYFSPLGAAPVDNVNATNNRYTSANYRISPYIESTTGGGTLYRLRNDNIWTTVSGAPVSVSNSYTNNLVGLLENTVNRLGWGLDAYRNEVTFKGQDSEFLNELGRARLIYKWNEAVRLTASVGYETLEFPTSNQRGVIYGAGVEWQPGARTQGTARWEERVFGSSYYVSLNHRRPWSAYQVLASRDIVTYPQLIGALTGGGGLDSLIGASFAARIPDPVARQAAVDAYVRQNALPSSLASPSAFYTQQVLLQETQSATFTLLGARNTVAFTAFHQRNQPLSGASGVLAPAELTFSNDTDQRGGSITWSHRLSGQTTFNVLTSVIDIETFLPAGRTDESRYYIARAILSHTLGPKTNAFVGVRGQRRNATISTDFREMALFVGMTHRF